MTPAEHRKGERRWIWNGEDAGLAAVDPFDEYPADGEILVPADDKRVLAARVLRLLVRADDHEFKGTTAENGDAHALVRQARAILETASSDSVQEGERVAQEKGQ